MPYLKAIVPVAEGNRGAALCHAEHAGGAIILLGRVESVRARAAPVANAASSMRLPSSSTASEAQCPLVKAAPGQTSQLYKPCSTNPRSINLV
jgi:hypothetical protein